MWEVEDAAGGMFAVVTADTGEAVGLFFDRAHAELFLRSLKQRRWMQELRKVADESGRYNLMNEETDTPRAIRLTTTKPTCAQVPVEDQS